MPQQTPLSGHAIPCIKHAVLEVLQAASGDDLTIVCDRRDCWSDAELFKYRQAINIETRSSSVGESIQVGSKPTGLDLKAKTCLYKSTLTLEIQIFVSNNECAYECGSPLDHAYSILSHVTQTLATADTGVLRRILPKGSDQSLIQDGDTDLSSISATFQVHYLFDPRNPGKVYKVK